MKMVSAEMMVERTIEEETERATVLAHFSSCQIRASQERVHRKRATPKWFLIQTVLDNSLITFILSTTTTTTPS
jgi:hypothetical protein